jgi:hypothetical protein
MSINKRLPDETLDDYHARLRAQQEDIDYSLRGRVIWDSKDGSVELDFFTKKPRPFHPEQRDARLLRSFEEFSKRPNKAGDLPFVNRKQERAYHSATPRHRRFAEDHPPINL